MERKAALKGLRIVDFSWQVMGPVCTKYLADFGAEVIKIESSRAFDAARGNLPYREGIPGVDRSCHYAWLNTGKRSITLNLKTPQGIEVVKKLISLSDVVVENFTPGTMEKLGLSYDTLKQINPGLIMVRLSGVGQDGPYRLMPALGNFIGAWAGLHNVFGLKGREPIISYLPHSDYLGGHAGVIAILASLLYRRKTGQGQCLDISMLEVTVPLIAPFLLDYLVNQRDTGPLDNKSEAACPHGIYRCAGQDRWCAISIFSDEEWSNFVKALGNPGWAEEPGLQSLAGRKAQEEALDREVEAWTQKQSVEEVVRVLQAHGVAAGIVANGKDLWEDPQLQSRNFVRLVEGHRELNQHYSAAASFQMSKTQPELKPACCFGQDNEYVFTQILGMSDVEFIQLLEAGVIL